MVRAADNWRLTCRPLRARPPGHDKSISCFLDPAGLNLGILGKGGGELMCVVMHFSRAYAHRTSSRVYPGRQGHNMSLALAH